MVGRTAVKVKDLFLLVLGSHGVFWGAPALDCLKSGDRIGGDNRRTMMQETPGDTAETETPISSLNGTRRRGQRRRPVTWCRR